MDDQEVRARSELLLFLSLPSDAGAKEIELVYLERRAEAEKRWRQGDRRARFEVERLDGVFGKLTGLVVDTEERGTPPPAVAKAKEPVFLRPAGSMREANGSFACGIAACLVVLWAFFVYWHNVRESSWDILNLLQSPWYFLIFLLALGAEMLSRAAYGDAERVRYVIKQGLEPTESLDERQISRARAGRYLGRIAVALAILLAIFLASSFSHFLMR